MKRYHIKWQLGWSFFHAAWHERLPSFRDWLLLLIGAAILTVAFKQYIYVATQAGWRPAVWQFANETFREIKEEWHR